MRIYSIVWLPEIMEKLDVKHAVAPDWESHDSADFWDEMEEVDFEVELRRNLLGVQPIILAYQPQDCPRCGQEFEDVQIEYLVNDNRRLLMVRDLPALRCREKGHLFVLEENVDRLEQLMALQGQIRSSLCRR